MTNLIIYLFGALVVATGIGFGMNALGVGMQWIIVAACVIVGFGIMGAVKSTQQKADPNE